ncbi:aftiphilin isoform X1 [Ornithorhynchus anatinus]|uniref:Aftiphilin n=1 Tax=Ornithorhynchus anatinus TaxID=9258 RepID=F7G6P3_ORNAN|nr:aftiphilin isoform X1 [Ornithorhynchus anatinus]
MEPDIIRMYSSSPPPLDNGAEDDEDDEFGEFGGFAEVSPSGVGFADFDAPNYVNSKEEFLPSNHFMPIHGFSESVEGLTSFKPVKNGKDKGSIAELSSPTKGQSDMLSSTTSKEIIQSRTSTPTIDAIESPGDLRKIEESRENSRTPESVSSEGFRIDGEVTYQDEQIDSCNGEKPSCLELLTNGYAVLETVNPLGAEDLDNITNSQGLKTLNIHSTELNLESLPQSPEEFADFASFSKKEKIPLEEKGRKVVKDRDTLTVQENNKINRVNELNSVKQVSSERSYENEEIFVEENQFCISETSVAISEDLSNGNQDPAALEQNELISSSTHPTLNAVDKTENTESLGRREQCETNEKLDLSTYKCAVPCVDDKASETVKLGDLPKVENNNISEEVQSFSSLPLNKNALDDFSEVKNDNCGNDSVLSRDTNEDDFGDFGTVSGTTPPFASTSQESMKAETLEKPSKQFAHFKGLGDDFGDFGDTSTAKSFTQSELKQTSDALSGEHEVTRPSSGSGVESVANLTYDSDGQFGDFDSVPKTRDEFQDSDDFADFSSAGPNQAAEWNAFEDEQKESCSWAAFGDEQAAESHHRKEAWQSHRTDESVDYPVTQKTPGGPLATLQGAISDHSQESAPSVQAALISRLQRIFEACFPAIPVSGAEEKVTSLKLLLENLEERTRETSTESGELLDVWTELQDIHEAYGLKYQWGGSHSNKKLLCSLGIDTRNILFTGNKKQPVIVPMYAAGLGMLEPTKEPLKPVSAAEKIASIGQTPPVSPEMNTCTSDQFQESLPPVQFDWSSSGLTNPLDASGGSTLLNLDFFGPVDDSSSSSTTTIPGVDPELYELTTSKLETCNSSLKVTDAFARLMSTVEKTSTSTRRPKKEEHLSEEAAKVIASLPDLTFMHAKVLMFPATLTPSTSCQDKVA